MAVTPEQVLDAILTEGVRAAEARAVRKTIGISRVCSSAASSRATDQPSSPGIITSRSTRSGRSLRARSSPSRPSEASNTSMPEAARFTRQSILIERSSSTTSTRRAVPALRLA